MEERSLRHPGSLTARPADPESGYVRAMAPDASSEGADPGRQLLRQLGFHDVEHESHVPFIEHLEGTQRLLQAWGEREELCVAGLLHSAYGTEYFRLDRCPERDEVRAAIGSEAEQIVWWWCSIARDTLDPEALTVLDRHRGERVSLTYEDLVDIATLWAADTVEQIGRMTPDERRFAAGLPAVLAHASAPARAAVEALGSRPPEI